MYINGTAYSAALSSCQRRLIASLYTFQIPAQPEQTTPESPATTGALSTIIDRYKVDPESVYNTWFIGGEERMKAFRSIRRGVKETVDAIATGKFGNDFKGSPLEVVLAAITEQKQLFEAAAHPFYWKPKLRIPDIYENESNKRAFGTFLNACLNVAREEQMLAEMSRLADSRIKGLGPGVASIVYFLHPTLVPPFNTAIVNGFNALFTAKQKLGSWESYFAMRETSVRANEEHRNLLSNDLGAFAGLLFEIVAPTASFSHRMRTRRLEKCRNEPSRWPESVTRSPLPTSRKLPNTRRRSTP